MSGAYWPKQVATILHQTLGYDDDILRTPLEQMDEYIKQRVATVPFEDILNMPVFAEDNGK
jgi:hypothetical protein